MNDTVRPQRALLICQDLFFISRITGTARELGWDVQTVSPREALDGLSEPGICGVLIDLTAPGLDLPSVTAAAGNVKTVAFGPHVQTGRLQAASDAGCDLVLPRSRFDATLVDILRGLFEPADG